MSGVPTGHLDYFGMLSRRSRKRPKSRRPPSGMLLFSNSLVLRFAPCCLKELRGRFRPTAIENAKFLALQPVVVRKESLEFVEKTGIKVLQGLHVCVHMSMRRDADKAIVADPGLAHLLRLGFNRTDEPNTDRAAHRNRILKRNEEVERVAVVRLCRGDESEIERENVALRQHGLEPDGAAIQIKRIFVSASLGVSITARTSPVSGSLCCT
jgi:hypothetical protein